MNDLASRLKHKVQLTTDGHKAYLEAIENAFGIDYAMLIKIYGKNNDEEKRYRTADIQEIKTKQITGTPNPKHISTSYAERQNLTMRMGMRRFTTMSYKPSC